MSVINSNALFMGDDGYTISRSVRLRSSASAYFSRTAGTPTNNKIFTFSFWLKRGSIGASQTFYSATNANEDKFVFSSTDILSWYNNSANDYYLSTTQVFRDPSAWYHIVFAFDTTQATASNRVKLYVNGTQVTSFSSSSYPSLNYSFSRFNTASIANSIGRDNNNGQYFDGYITEVNFIDGQALTPSSFGENDAVTGVWKPKKYTGTYGNNGFYLNFSDNSAATAAAIGKDSSGNGNNWTPNNISVTAGSTYDSMIDVPTPYADGGTGRGNYAVFNAVAKASSQPTFSNANLNLSASSAWNGAVGTIGVTSGKWYWEVVNGNSDAYVGICGDNLVLGTADPQTLTGAITYYAATGEKRVDGAMTAYGASYSTETIGVALDVDGGTVTFYKNNTSQGALSLSSSTLNGKTIFPFFVKYASTVIVNFGQRPFSYTPPAGFKALNTQNLSEPTIKKGNTWFDTSLWTGNGSARSITNSGSMQPDLVWVKSRSQAIAHRLVDAVRGAGATLASNLTNAEFTDAQGVTSFNSNGFGIGTDTSYNQSADTYVGWQWKKGATPGFDIVTYTGNGAASQTLNHSLGVVPAMMITKQRGATGDWFVYHKSANASPQSGALFLELTNAFTSNSGYWNNTAPTSSQFTVGSAGGLNASSVTAVAYLFAEVAGFSKFGSYTGNGSTDGTFVYLGFRPRWLMVKCSSNGSTNWVVIDTSRDTYNLAGQSLEPNLSNAEYTPASSGYPVDILSNGFKWRDSGSFSDNYSGYTYIYAAFAENPFKYSLAR